MRATWVQQVSYVRAFHRCAQCCWLRGRSWPPSVAGALALVLLSSYYQWPLVQVHACPGLASCENYC
jgi:hypothetical protein